MDKKRKIKIGITPGDINGVGYELVMKVFSDVRMQELCTPVIYGSPKAASYHRKLHGMHNFNYNAIQNVNDAQALKNNLINCLDDSVRVELGKPTQMSVEASIICLDRAVDDLINKKIDALIAGPMHKDKNILNKYNFYSQAEFLMQKAEVKEYVPLAVNDMMRVGVVASNVPLAEVTNRITQHEVMRKLETLNKSITEDFAIAKPKIAVLSLNSSAVGLCKEETGIIIPTIEKANKNGMLTFGPFFADDFFESSDFENFDAILAMHHDQGIAPFNAINSDSGVKYTAGLPIICIEPKVNACYEIAGQGKASPNSFRESIYKACDIFRNRKIHTEIAKNPLAKHESKKA